MYFIKTYKTQVSYTKTPSIIGFIFILRDSACKYTKNIYFEKSNVYIL